MMALKIIHFCGVLWSKSQFKKKIELNRDTFFPHPNKRELSKMLWFLEQNCLFVGQLPREYCLHKKMLKDNSLTRYCTVVKLPLLGDLAK